MRRAVVVDPLPLWRRVVEQVLRLNGAEVVAAVELLREASMRIDDHRPDLVVVEPEGQDEPEVWLREQRDRHPTMKVIVFSGRADSEAIESALTSGAAAYVLKRSHLIEIDSVLRQLDHRSIYFGGDRVPVSLEVRQGSKELERSGLTPREREILSLVAEGAPTKLMATSLWVTEQTIKFHLSNIYRKLGVNNRTQASRWAHDQGLAIGAAGAAARST